MIMIELPDKLEVPLSFLINVDLYPALQIILHVVVMAFDSLNQLWTSEIFRGLKDVTTLVTDAVSRVTTIISSISQSVASVTGTVLEYIA